MPKPLNWSCETRSSVLKVVWPSFGHECSPRHWRIFISVDQCRRIPSMLLPVAKANGHPIHPGLPDMHQPTISPRHSPYTPSGVFCWGVLQYSRLLLLLVLHLRLLVDDLLTEFSSVFGLLLPILVEHVLQKPPKTRQRLTKVFLGSLVSTICWLG